MKKQSQRPKPRRAAAKATRPSSKPARTARAPAAGVKPLPVQMLDLITGYWTSQMVFVVARLGIADHLAKGARSAADLAAAVGADAGRLQRLLRALAAHGLFVERAARFALTPLGRTLVGDAPGSMRDFALMMVDDYNWQAWAALHDGIVHPLLPFEKVHGGKVFDYLSRHPGKLQTFAGAMASLSASENPAIASGYAFGRHREVVDVGGSHGHLLAAVLRAHPGVRGLLFDLPDVVAQAQQAPFLTTKELAGRVDFAAGDFFASVPAGADAYLMKYILHDWNDDLCVQILDHCRRAMGKGGRVLVVDTVIPAGSEPHWGKALDVNMLVLTGGRERTAADFKALFAAAGLQLKKVHATACPLSIVEAAAAP